jgi:hypothetical protein
MLAYKPFNELMLTRIAAVYGGSVKTITVKNSKFFGTKQMVL